MDIQISEKGERYLEDLSKVEIDNLMTSSEGTDVNLLLLLKHEPVESIERFSNMSDSVIRPALRRLFEAGYIEEYK